MMAKKDEPTYDDLVVEYNEAAAEDPDGDGLIEQITTITPENIAELIADYLDGVYDENFEVRVSAMNDRHAIRISVRNDEVGIDDGFILFVRKDNAA